MKVDDHGIQGPFGKKLKLRMITQPLENASTSLPRPNSTRLRGKPYLFSITPFTLPALAVARNYFSERLDKKG
jgi:hypothetical protein